MSKLVTGAGHSLSRWRRIGHNEAPDCSISNITYLRSMFPEAYINRSMDLDEEEQVHGHGCAGKLAGWSL